MKKKRHKHVEGRAWKAPPVSFTQRDRILLITLVIGMITGMIVLPLVGARNQRIRQMERMLTELKRDYHLSENQFSTVRAEEYRFHGTADWFLPGVHEPLVVQQHVKTIADSMNPEDGERFSRAASKEKH